MGRWGTDAVAVACIAGGALVGSGVTTALVSASEERQAERVEVVCASKASPRVVVRLSSGSAAVSTRTIQIRSGSSARCTSAHFDVQEIEGKVEEAMERAELARIRFEREFELDRAAVLERRASIEAQVERARLQLDEARFRAAAARAAAEKAGDEARQQINEARLARQVQVRLKQLHELEGRLSRTGDSMSERDEQAVQELEAALEAVRASLREDLEQLRSSGGSN